jgi:FAD/FMN-containing dehydrogenase/Fe-S oxidoreductase
VSPFERDLRGTVDGEVDFSEQRRGEYAYDASVYRRVPLGVVFPRSAEDVAAAVRVARDHDVPITARGAGTSIAGNAIGEGLVLDFSRHLDRIVEIDPERRIATVQPGVILDHLNAAAGRYGLRFGPDPSSRSRCVLGGMIGNNACGTRALIYGRTSDNVESLDVVRYDGTRLTAGAYGDEPGDPVIEELRALRDRHLATIRTSLGRFPRQVSGYALEHLLPENGFNVARALVGSEGTCALTLGATLRLVEEPTTKVLAVLGFPDFVTAAEVVPRVLTHRPSACEGLDAHIARMAGGAGLLRDAGSWLLVEFGGDDAEERARALAREFPGTMIETDPARQAAVWRIRNDGAGLASRTPDGAQAWPGWEDSAVPPDRLGPYLRDLRALFDRHGLRGAAYGHFGEGCLHIRIDFDLMTEAGRARFREVVEEATRLVVSYGGVPSGEHGDGRARSEVLPMVYDNDTLKAFGEFKGVWDPAGRLNPGIIVDPEPVDDRLRTEGMPPPPRTFLPFAEDHGDFRQALHRCVGVGKCRSHQGGVMCPSYRATLDETHSTRGRARLLEEMLRGELITDGWRSEAVHDALDLCLSCKGCASDCPVGVDMATYKSEFLHHHYRRRIRPMAHYSMGWLPLWLRLARAPIRAAAAPGRVTRALAGVAKRLGGVAPQRDLPAPARQPFSRWFRRRAPRAVTGETRRQVLLWPDTFTNFFTPSAGRAAVRILEDAGYEVLVPSGPVCCGLTWMSTGQLNVARKVARRSLDAVHPYAERGVPIVGLEPSCTAALRSDWPKLLHGDPRLTDLRVLTFAELLEEAGWSPPRRARRAVGQIHCHQHAELGKDADLRLLARAGVEVEFPDSGCCGLAGDFGFERGHYDLSVAIAERGLAPAVRAADPGTIVLADGFSCRTQIEQLTGRRAVHLAEILAEPL